MAKWKSFYRQPRTRAEMAAHQDPELEELGIKVRRKRLALSDSWSDQGREQGRCWKRYRRTQYRTAV